MNRGSQGAFDGAVALHRCFILDPGGNADGEALVPGRTGAPERWTPSFAPMRPYIAADTAALGLGGVESFHELGDACLDGAIARVLAVEGPVHFDVLAERLLEGAGAGRLGSRIRARIEARRDALAQAGKVVLRADFIGRERQFLRPQLRDWREAPEKTRDLDYVPDSELMLALLRTLAEHEPLGLERVLNDGIERIGFARLTGRARNRLQAPLRALLREGMAEPDGEGSLILGREAFLRR